MTLDDEVTGLRSRLSRIKIALTRVNDPLASSLLQSVANDIEERLRTLMPLPSVDQAAPEGAVQQQQQPQTEIRSGPNRRE